MHRRLGLKSGTLQSRLHASFTHLRLERCIDRLKRWGWKITAHRGFTLESKPLSTPTLQTVTASTFRLERRQEGFEWWWRKVAM